MNLKFVDQHVPAFSLYFAQLVGDLGRVESARNAVSQASLQPAKPKPASSRSLQNYAQTVSPEGDAEEESFRRYGLSTVHIDHAQALELQAQYRWAIHPDHPIWFPQMERLIRPGVLHEIRKLQGELYAGNKAVTCFKVLPSASLSAISLPAATEAANFIAKRSLYLSQRTI